MLTFKNLRLGIEVALLPWVAIIKYYGRGALATFPMFNNKHFSQFWRMESRRSRCLLRALSYFQGAIFLLCPHITSLWCMHVRRVAVRHPVWTSWPSTFHSPELFMLSLFTCSVMPSHLWPHELPHTRAPCPPISYEVFSPSCPLSQWYHRTISSSAPIMRPPIKWKSESEVAQLCPTLCNPEDCSLLGSSVHGILQARTLEWVTISFSRGSSQPRNQTRVSCIWRQTL